MKHKNNHNSTKLNGNSKFKSDEATEIRTSLKVRQDDDTSAVSDNIFILVNLPIEGVRNAISMCQKVNHIHQVAYSTYHNGITQICFTCKRLRSSLKIQ